MKKLLIILLFSFGFFMIPSITYACGKQSCKKEISKTENKGCCGQKNDSKGNHDGCRGKCGHKDCQCASVIIGGIVLGNSFEIWELPLNQILNKRKFYYPENHLSSGYDFIWLIPKIS